ncbi:MFS transporter [Cytobacillus sp. IB215665]|uniref:MDR family MFS transporter n=1 Tax=Cytobacillus sp. IB215665 TaxID=3097357 RepID=UPI002A113089|nr:MFS transporter [Cytobacillus sp. IB215665]MDX8365440.1 MFS transporter [Cytobacillus sp. IB215665]
MLKELHPNIRIRIYTSFLSRVIASMIFPFMAIYYTRELNATYAGFFILTQVVIQFFSSLYGGYFADTIGRKKMMVIGEWMKVFAFLGMITVNSPIFTSPLATFLMVIIMGVASGLINPAAEAMLIDVSTKETRTLMYSINYWAVNLSIMLGLLVGGWLFKTHFFELLIILFFISIITLTMTITLIKETFTSKKTVEALKPYGIKPLLLSYQTVIKDIPFVLFTIGGIAILSLEHQRNNFIAVRLEGEIIPTVVSLFGNIQFSLDGVKLLSLLFVGNTLIIVLFTSFVSKFIKNKAEQPIMYTGCLLFGAGYAILSFSNDFLLLFIAIIILSIGELLFVPTRQSILADIVEDNRRGAYMAFNGFIFQFGKMFGALGIIVGQQIGGIGMSFLYILFAFIGIAFARLGILKSYEKRKDRTSSTVV